MNQPDTKFPKLPSHLKTTDKKLKFIKTLETYIPAKAIKKVRISIQKLTNITFLYPEFEYKNKWYVFRKDYETVLIFKVTNPSISGISFNTSKIKIDKTKAIIQKWIKEWIKENRLNIKFKEEEKSEAKETIKETRAYCPKCGATCLNSCIYCGWNKYPSEIIQEISEDIFVAG